jgi:gliding motility-associated-like protein
MTVPVPNPSPTPLILGTPFTCSSNTTTLYVDSAALYTNITWSNASTNDTVITNIGTYTVSVTQTGCTSSSPAVTVVNFNPVVNIIGNLSFCHGDSTSLFANANISTGNYLWNTSETTMMISATNSGNYSVTVSYANGCSTADTVTVSLYAEPHAGYTMTPADVTFLGNTTSFTDASGVTPGSITNWYWNFGDSTGSVSLLQNPTHLYGQTGVYHVTHAIQSNNGCWDTIRFDCHVISDLEVPNVFTPNGDGKNDFLEFRNIEYFPNTGITVFNRWGNKVYTSSDYHNNWDGGGHPDGVYYYILEGPELKEPKYGFVQVFNN